MLATQAAYQQTIGDLTTQQKQAQEMLDGARRIAANTPLEVIAARDSEQQQQARYKAGLATVVDVSAAGAALAQAEGDDALARVKVPYLRQAKPSLTGSISAIDRSPSIIHDLIFLQKRLQPAEHSRPAAEALRHLGVSGKPTMLMPYQRAVVLCLQLPANGGLYLGGPTRRPRLYQQTWRIDLDVFARRFKRTSLRIDSCTPPASALAQIAFKVRAAKTPALSLTSPPLHYQFGVNQCPEHIFGRSGYVNLADDCVAIIHDRSCSHVVSLHHDFPRRLAGSLLARSLSTTVLREVRLVSQKTRY